MDDARRIEEFEFPTTARVRRVERAVIAEYIHDLSDRHRPNPCGGSRGRAAPHPPDPGND